MARAASFYLLSCTPSIDVRCFPPANLHAPTTMTRLADDDEIVPDSQEGSDLEQKYLTTTQIDTAAIYNKIMAAKDTQAAHNSESASSESVTEPDDDIPACLRYIPMVCIL